MNNYPTILRIVSFRYALIALVLLTLFSVQATNGILFGDFWEHAALVELVMSSQSLSAHPLFHLQAAHAFLSPYPFYVAGLAQLFRASNIEALLLAGIFNFVLFVFGLYFFCRSIYKSGAWLSSSYAILFILFLWGSNPWGYSGFLHFDVIVSVLAYPSTFALGVTLLSLSIQTCSSNKYPLLVYFVTYIAFAVVILCHPLTAIFFSCGLIGHLYQVSKTTLRRTILLTASGILISTSLAIQWPYFSLIDLITGAGNIYHPENRSMYVDVLSRIWPTLAALPLAAWALKDRKAQYVTLTILMLCGVYIYGGLTEKYSFGRVISIIVILLQILIAVGVARLELTATRNIPALKIILPVALFTTIIYFSFPWLKSTTTRALTVVNSIRLDRPVSNQTSYKDLLFLKDYVNNDSTVLSDLGTSWIVPSIRGKVIGALHPQAFVADQRQRFDDVNLFFDKSATTTQRLWIAEKSQAQYLLLNKHTTTNYAELQQLFTENRAAIIVYDSDHYVLLKLPLPH